MPMFKVHPAVARGVGKDLVLGGNGSKARAWLGRLSELGPTRDVWLDLDSEHVVAIVGKRGSGKTHTLGVLIEALADASTAAGLSVVEGTSTHAIVVFDTLNLFQWVGIP